jgi:dephospho-CoA kinase
MLIVGLTGGIGSGKSVVAELFAQKNVPVIDADVISRELTQPQQNAYQSILNFFGPEIIATNFTINRPALRKIIFADETKRQWLENLLHPLIRTEIIKRIEQLNAPYCMVVVPLLLENNAYDFIDRICVVDAAEEVQIARVSLRDQVSTAQVKAILGIQLKRDARLAQADDVIINNGTLSALHSRVSELHDFYLSLSKQNIGL